MLIGIDGNEANVETRLGVNTYAHELLKSLALLQGKGEMSHDLIVYLKDEPLPDMPEETTKFKYKVIKGAGMWILTKLTPHLIKTEKKLDLFFSPSHYVPFLAPLPKVCSIMDLGYLDFTEQFPKKIFWQLKWWSAISIIVSKKVLAISNSTAENIVRHYPKSLAKVSVTYLGYDKKQFNYNISDDDVRHIKKKYSIVSDYVLYIGTLKPSKNLEHLVESFGIVNREFPQTVLVIAGKKGWLYETIFSKVEELKLKDKIIFTDFIPEEDKAALIKGAKVFAIPSLWEGFGLDALNALGCGVPVVAGNTGSLPEVVGDAGILVDPRDIENIAWGIKKVLRLGKTEYNSMVKRSLIQSEKFSWVKCARETVKILESAIK